MPPIPWIVNFGMAPPSTPCSACVLLDAFVLVPVSGDCKSVSDEPCPNVFTVASHGADHAVVFVVSLDFDPDIPAGNRSDQGTLDPRAFVVPIAELVFCHLIQLRRIEASQAYVFSSYLDGVTVDHIRLPGDGAFPEQSLEAKENCCNGKDDNKEFHASIYSALLHALSIKEYPDVDSSSAKKG